MLKSVSGACGSSSKETTIWPVPGSAWTEPGELDVGAEAVRREDQAVGVRPAAVRRGRSRRGSGPAVPSCRSRASRLSSLPGRTRGRGCRSRSRRPAQSVLPSAALGLIEKPGREGHLGALDLRRRRGERIGYLRDLEVDVETGGRVAFGRRRLHGQARVEGGLAAAGRRRPWQRPGVEDAVVKFVSPGWFRAARRRSSGWR